MYLYRECSKILRENHQKWLERKANEQRKKLEEEKLDRLENAARKKTEIKKKFSKPKIKKETKPEYARRMETEKKLKGLHQTKSNLWKQRRDRDEAALRNRKVLKNGGGKN